MRAGPPATRNQCGSICGPGAARYGKPSRSDAVDAPQPVNRYVAYHRPEPDRTLLANGIDHVALTDWKSATADMKDLEIDNYLAEIVVAIDDLGGRVISSDFVRAAGYQQ